VLGGTRVEHDQVREAALVEAAITAQETIGVPEGVRRDQEVGQERGAGGRQRLTGGTDGHRDGATVGRASRHPRLIIQLTVGLVPI